MSDHFFARSLLFIYVAAWIFIGTIAFIGESDAQSQTVGPFVRGDAAPAASATINANVTVIGLQPIADRELITLTNPTATGFGIPTSAFHLSNDPSVVGSVGQNIFFIQDIPQVWYLVGPSADGPGGAGIEHNGTVTGIEFEATWNGVQFDYEVLNSVRHHPGPGDWATRSYDSVFAQQTLALSLVEYDFNLLWGSIDIQGSASQSSASNAALQSVFVGTFTEELTACPAGTQEVDGTLILNGALDYPIVATKNPSWVSSGRDLQLPDWSGLFIRNSGSQSDYVAAAPGVLQDDGTAPNGLAGTVSRTANNNVSTAVDGGGGQNVRFNNTTRSVNFTSADGETRPGNVALIKCVILEL